MRYFGYQIPEGGAIFIGNNREQIINTINYYKKDRGQSRLEIPLDSDILELNKIEISCARPWAKIDHELEVRINPQVTFYVNENAIEHVRMQGINYEELKRGELYKFYSGVPVLGTWLLPEDIMKGINDYNWDVHRFKINAWDNELGLKRR